MWCRRLTRPSNLHPPPPSRYVVSSELAAFFFFFLLKYSFPCETWSLNAYIFAEAYYARDKACGCTHTGNIDYPARQRQGHESERRGVDKKMGQVLSKYQNRERRRAQSVFLLQCRRVRALAACVLCELIRKQPLMVKPYLSTIIAGSAAFASLNVPTRLIRFPVIPSQRAGREVRTAVVSLREKKKHVLLTVLQLPTNPGHVCQEGRDASGTPRAEASPLGRRSKTNTDKCGEPKLLTGIFLF